MQTVGREPSHVTCKTHDATGQSGQFFRACAVVVIVVVAVMLVAAVVAVR